MSSLIDNKYYMQGKYKGIITTIIKFVDTDTHQIQIYHLCQILSATWIGRWSKIQTVDLSGEQSVSESAQDLCIKQGSLLSLEYCLWHSTQICRSIGKNKKTLEDKQLYS